eukprot:6207403-Pleurochrysis_carterae.AAC.3
MLVLVHSEAFIVYPKATIGTKQMPQASAHLQPATAMLDGVADLHNNCSAQNSSGMWASFAL